MPDPSLIEALRRALAVGPGDALCVGYSGGADSTALLHALAALPEARTRGLRAVHVHHGLHPQADEWAAHCIRFSASLDVPLAVLRVVVDDARGEGLEAAARRARYDAFARVLHAGEALVLAHHRDDQIETVLLKLLRGAGPEGLGGMRAARSFAGGRLWRPLLDLPRTVLREYVRGHGLSCIDDPANADPRFSRNVLRGEILPRLAAHWPQVAQSIAQSAAACRAASAFIDTEAARNLAIVRGAQPTTLEARTWLALPDALRAPLLERWLREIGLPAPTVAQRAELERQIDSAQTDRVPRVTWPGAELRVWHGMIHAMRPLPPVPELWQARWDGSPLRLPAGAGVLSLCQGGVPTTARIDPPLRVRFRSGGEHIKPAGDPHTRELRDLFQRAGIPPWQRARCPLIWSGEELIAVADLWLSESGSAYFASLGGLPRWAPEG